MSKKITPHGRYRTTYATGFKIAVMLDMVPGETLKKIPKSTLWSIRTSDLSHVFGLEYSDLPEEVIQLLKSLMKKKKLLKIYKAYSRLKTTVISIFSQIKTSNLICENTKKMWSRLLTGLGVLSELRKHADFSESQRHGFIPGINKSLIPARHLLLTYVDIGGRIK